MAIALTGWLLLRAVASRVSASNSVPCAALDLGYQHSQRLQVAAARAAADALGMSTGFAASYQADYRRQRMQIQADSEGLDRWAAHDVRHQGLLQEIRASLAGLDIALDQTAGTASSSVSIPQVPLLPSLDRAETALSNYSASLAQAQPVRPAREMPLLVALLFVVELAALAWLLLDLLRIKMNDRLP